MTSTENKKTKEYKRLRQSFKQLSQHVLSSPEYSEDEGGLPNLEKSELIKQELTLQLNEDIRRHAILTNTILKDSKSAIDHMAKTQNKLVKLTSIFMGICCVISVISLLFIAHASRQANKNIALTDELIQTIGNTYEMTGVLTINELKEIKQLLKR